MTDRIPKALRRAAVGRRSGGRARQRPLAYLVGAVGLVRARRRLGIPRAASTLIAATAPLAAFRLGPPGRRRAAITWAAHMWAYEAAFEIPHDAPERQRRRLIVDWPIAADTRLTPPAPPSLGLQRRLRHPPRLTALDYALTFLYALWDLEPHAALAWILTRDERRFPAAAARLAATFDLTLLGYWLVPQAPPWWASEEAGRMEGEVRRVAPEVMRELRGEPRPALTHYRGANPWAAMPSDHFATALMTAAVLADSDPRLGLAGAVYALLLGFALLYLGEHYLVDLIAGAALAGAVELALHRRFPLSIWA
jgi:membrane-associated phospholipid phosphatase